MAQQYSHFYADTESRLRRLLADVRGSFTEAEEEEVTEFLDAQEYGLALNTLSGILVEEKKLIVPGVLHQINELAAAMQLRRERFITVLQIAYDSRQQPPC